MMSRRIPLGVALLVALICGCSEEEEAAENQSASGGGAGGSGLISLLNQGQPPQQQPSDTGSAAAAPAGQPSNAPGINPVAPMPDGTSTLSPLPLTNPTATGTPMPQIGAAPAETPPAESFEPQEITAEMPVDVPVIEGSRQIRGELSEDGDVIIGVWVLEGGDSYRYVAHAFHAGGLDVGSGALYDNGWRISRIIGGFGQLTEEIVAQKSGRTLSITVEQKTDAVVLITMELEE
jgi:hypothetical protein